MGGGDRLKVGFTLQIVSLSYLEAGAEVSGWSSVS